MLTTLILTTLAYAAPAQPQIADPVQSLIQLEGQLKAAEAKAQDKNQDFREELPLTSPKKEATLEQLPLGPSDE